MEVKALLKFYGINADKAAKWAKLIEDVDDVWEFLEIHFEQQMPKESSYMKYHGNVVLVID